MTTNPTLSSRLHEKRYGKLAMECVACTTDTGKTDSHCLTLKAHKSVSTGFGSVNRDLTFYMRVTAPCKVGTTAELDTDAFDIIERPFIPEGNDPDDVIWLKNLVTKITSN